MVSSDTIHFELTFSKDWVILRFMPVPPMNEPLQRILSLSLSEVKSRCKLHLNVMNSEAARTLGGRGQEPGKRVIPRWWACGARQARVNCWSWAPRAPRPCRRASRPVHKIEMGCSGRDKDIVMTRGNKGIRARGRIVVEHAVVINALQCGGVLAPNPCLALALDIQYKIQNIKYKVQNTKYKIQNAKYETQKNTKSAGACCPLTPAWLLHWPVRPSWPL